MFPAAFAVVPATYVVPKLMLTDPPELNPDPVTVIVAPQGPCVELNDMATDEETVAVEDVVVTVNDAVAWLPAESVTVTAYVP